MPGARALCRTLNAWRDIALGALYVVLCIHDDHVLPSSYGPLVAIGAKCRKVQRTHAARDALCHPLIYFSRMAASQGLGKRARRAGAW